MKPAIDEIVDRQGVSVAAQALNNVMNAIMEVFQRKHPMIIRYQPAKLHYGDVLQPPACIQSHILAIANKADINSEREISTLSEN